MDTFEAIKYLSLYTGYPPLHLRNTSERLFLVIPFLFLVYICLLCIQEALTLSPSQNQRIYTMPEACTGLNEIFAFVDFHVVFIIMVNGGLGIIPQLSVFKIFTWYMFIYFQKMKSKYISRSWSFRILKSTLKDRNLQNFREIFVQYFSF